MIELPILDASTVAAKSGHARSQRPHLPDWLRTKLPTGEALAKFNGVRATVSGNILHTVCEEAQCPNIHDCWSRGSATFMVAGEACTRGCRFCAVETIKSPPALDPQEPARLAHAVETMRLKHVVITVVNRDDLSDGGAGHYRNCVLAVHERSPGTSVELLCSDLEGNFDALQSLLVDLPLKVFAHNVECVPRLDRQVRDPRASFAQSLEILQKAKEFRPDLITKSSLMVGVGETDAEVSEAMRFLRRVDVDLLTIGQYLAPSGRHLPVDRFVPPARFAGWEVEAKEMGFWGVASGPMVRSSYRAETLLENAQKGRIGLSQATIRSSE